MKPFRPLVFTVLAIALFSSRTVAGPKSLGLRPAEEPAAPEGLEFSDGLVGECMELVRAGKADEAIARIKKEAANAVGPRRAELMLGQAMVLLRADQKQKAMQILKPLISKGNDESVVLRAKVIERVASKSKSAGGAVELASVTGWEQVLTAAAKEIPKDVAKEHQLLYSSLVKLSGDDAIAHMKNAHALLDQADCIKVAGVDEGRGEAVRKHLEGLANGIRRTNDWIDSAVRDAHNMEVQIKGNRPRGRKYRAAGGDPSQVDEYNKLCDDIERAWEAGKQLQDEYEQVANARGLSGMNQRARMRIPIDRLPKRITQP